MDLLNLLGVIRRRWVIILVGLFVGEALVFATVYQIDQGKVRQKSHDEFTIEMQMIVIDPYFGIGRALGTEEEPDTFGKSIALASTYSRLLTSDAVRSLAETSAGSVEAEIAAEPLQDAPIIVLTLQGRDKEQMSKYAVALGTGLESYLKAQQDERDVPSDDRMSVQMLAEPRSTQVQSRQWEMAAIAFLAPFFGALGVAVLRDRAIAARYLEGEKGHAKHESQDEV